MITRNLLTAACCLLASASVAGGLWQSGLTLNPISLSLLGKTSKTLELTNPQQVDAQYLVWGASAGFLAEREIKERDLTFHTGAQYQFSNVRMDYQQNNLDYHSSLILHEAIVPFGMTWMPYDVMGMKVGPTGGIALKAIVGNHARQTVGEDEVIIYDDKANVTFRDSEMQIATVPYLGFMVDSGALDGSGWYYSIVLENVSNNLIFDGFDINMMAIELRTGIWF